MAMIKTILLQVLNVGCVLSQSTTGDSDTSLQEQMAQLHQQQLQMVKVLDHLLQNQHQQLNKLNELYTSFSGNPGM